MSSSQYCPKCGLKTDRKVAFGLCPACLLQEAMHPTSAQESEHAKGWVPPPVDVLSAAFPNLDILELVGNGGMGAVYKVRQQTLDRIVALKILAPHYAADPDFAVRFTREAKLLGGLSHPNIVAVHDFGYSNGFYFLLMEFVDGVNLRQAMSVAKLSPEQALRIVPPICDALQYAHDRGIVHRDIKPENLLLDKAGQIKIVDFGIARIFRKEPTLSDANPSEAFHRDPVDSDSASEVGDATKVMGTPRYMAPEQISAPKTVDHRADIYALGVVFYEMLTGETPSKAIELPSSKVEIDIRLDSIVMKALQAEPARRYSTAGELRQSIITMSLERPTSQAILPKLTLHERGIITAYENLRSSWNKLFLWKQNGFLELTDHSLSLRIHSQEDKIDLASIRRCELGLFPPIVNPCGLYYIRLDYFDTNKSAIRTLCIAPYGIRVGLPASFNDQVLHWYGELVKCCSAVQQKPIPAQFDQQLPKRPFEMAFFGFLAALPTIVIPLVLLRTSLNWSYSLAAFPIAVVLGIAIAIGASHWNWSRIKRELSNADSVEGMIAVNQRQRKLQMRVIPLMFLVAIAAIATTFAMFSISIRNRQPLSPAIAPMER
jgi:serine/threonine protein kinase